MTSGQKAAAPRPSAWPLVLCLVGLDYFSTLAYLPSIAVEAAGWLAPLAALLVAMVTLLLAVPIYWYVVGRSPHGRGATGLIERNVHGWRGKILVLVLLGFAAADFVITRSLSVADAAIHLIHNPHGQALLDQASPHVAAARAWFGPTIDEHVHRLFTRQVTITMGLSLLTFAFWSLLRWGFTRRMLQLAAVVVGCYLAMASIVIVSGLAYLIDHPARIESWLAELVQHAAQDSLDHSAWAALLPLALWCFPQMALGLSGFELTMTIAPLVRGKPDDDPERPAGRIRNVRKLMFVAAAVMSVYMFGAVLVTTLLVPHEALAAGGPARHRALAYIAHGGSLAGGVEPAEVSPWFGEQFGNLYDLSSVVILCLAGASVMLGLRNLLPVYLHRLGMELSWAGRLGVMMHLLNGVILLVTLVFHASLSSQQWAYATSVLVLLSGAALAAATDVAIRSRGSAWRPARLALPALVCGFFLTMTTLTMFINRSGLVIASAFVLTILITSFISRWIRSTELRFEGFSFADEKSRLRWEALCKLPFQVVVPHRPGKAPLVEKDALIRHEFRVEPGVPVIFVEVTLGDPSEFYQAPRMHIEREGALEVIRVVNCVSVAHTLAAICLELGKTGRPPEIIFGWSLERPLAANLNFLLLGEGNIPWMVKELVRKAAPDPARQPRILIG